MGRISRLKSTSAAVAEMDIIPTSNSAVLRKNIARETT